MTLLRGHNFLTKALRFDVGLHFIPMDNRHVADVHVEMDVAFVDLPSLWQTFLSFTSIGLVGIIVHSYPCYKNKNNGLIFLFLKLGIIISNLPRNSFCVRTAAQLKH